MKRLTLQNCNMETLMIEQFTCARSAIMHRSLGPQAEPQYRRAYWLHNTGEVIHHGVIRQVFGMMLTIV